MFFCFFFGRERVKMERKREIGRSCKRECERELKGRRRRTIIISTEQQ